ncbi:MAG: DUF4038 domain-containing protein, partial [Bacteroidota bacterium]
MKRIGCLLLFFIYFSSLEAQLRISEDGRHILDKEGKAFFWLGDTAWELLHRLNREESAAYLANRAAKGFSVIQCVVLAELEGLTVPNANGDLPLMDQDPAQPNEAYFTHIDFVLDEAEKQGLYLGLLPTWGDKFNRKWGVGPEVFNPENAAAFGRFLAERYRGRKIIWILGGDRNPEEAEDFAIVRAMAEAIRSVVKDQQLITYHPQGGYSSSNFFHEDQWLDLNLYQSGHGEFNNQNYKRTLADAGREHRKPVIDGEPCYEDHPINWNGQNGWFDAFDSRRAGYWSMLAGAAGHTYGNHNIWQMWQDGRDAISQARTPWQQALDYPGAFQAGFMQRLFASRPWQSLMPNQPMLRSGPNTNGRDVRAASASDGSFALVYMPYGDNIQVDLSPIRGEKVLAWWYNPRMGTSIRIGFLK